MYIVNMLLTKLPEDVIYSIERSSYFTGWLRCTGLSLVSFRQSLKCKQSPKLVGEPLTQNIALNFICEIGLIIHVY